MTTTQTAEITSAKTCLCGCGSATASRFAPGHDAKLKGALLRSARAGDKTAARQMVTLGWVRFLDSNLVPAPRFTNRNSKGRFARTHHIDSFPFDDQLDGFWTDGVASHSHPTCSDIQGVTFNEASPSEWLCCTCIHTAHGQVWN